MQDRNKLTGADSRALQCGGLQSVPCRVRNLPLWALGALGVFTPVLREFSEMSFCWDRRYQVDSSKFTQAFWSDVTPFELGIPAAALSFRAWAAA